MATINTKTNGFKTRSPHAIAKKQIPKHDA